MSTLTLNKTEAVKLKVEIPAGATEYYKKSIFPFLRKFSKLVYGWLKEGRLKKIRDKQFYFSDDTPDLYGSDKGKLPENRTLDDGRIKSVPEVKALIDEHFPPEDKIWSTGISSLIYQVGNRYSSYGIKKGKRGIFAVPKKYIAFTPKACTWKSETFQYNLKDKIVTVRAMEGLRNDIRQFELPVIKDYYDNGNLLKRVPINKKLKKMMAEGEITEEEAVAESDLAKRGGNIVFKKNEVVFPITRQLEIEKAETWIAYDCNLTKMNFLAFSHPSYLNHPEGVRLFPKTEEITHWEGKISEWVELMNKADNKALFSHRERKWIRKNLDKAHCQQYKYIEEFLKPHLCHFLEEYGRHGWAIDTVKTGDRNGTFGQDKIPIIISRYCMKNKLPFYFIASFYTSQRCSLCGNVDREARNKDTNIYECTSPFCDFREQADLNASINHSQFGLTLQDAEWPMVSHMPSAKSRENYSLAAYLNNYYGLC